MFTYLEIGDMSWKSINYSALTLDKLLNEKYPSSSQLRCNLNLTPPQF